MIHNLLYNFINEQVRKAKNHFFILNILKIIMTTLSEYFYLCIDINNNHQTLKK